MAGTTTNLSLPYPEGTDANDVPADILALANALDAIVVPDTTYSAKGDILAASGAATPAAVTVGTDDQVLVADSTAASGVAWSLVDTGSIATDAVTADKIEAGAVGNTEIRDASATSVVGRSSGTVGDVADIAATADGQILRRASGALAFGTVDSSYVSNFTEAVQDAVDALISAGTHSAITVTYDDANNKLSFAHSDTSTVSDSVNTGATVIQSLTFDTYGHVLSRGTKTLAASDVGAVSNTADSSTAYTLTVGATGKYLRIRDTVNNSHYISFATADLNANRTITFPNNSGTVALTSDFATASVASATSATSATSANDSDKLDGYHHTAFWKIHVHATSAPSDTGALWIKP